MSTETAIRAAGIRKSFDDVAVLRGVDLEVPAGSVFALLGPNGAGKTTMVRILATLLCPDAGEVHVAGYDVATAVHRVRRSISLTGQHAAVDELLTGVETLEMMGRLWGLSGPQARVRARELLDRFDLSRAARRQVRHYSGGMRRRLDLAASLVGHPAVVFLDEPTTGLDIRSRQTMWEAVRKLATGGSTIFLTTQYLEEADQLAEQVVILDGGRIAGAGTPIELKARVGGERLQLVLVTGPAFDEVCTRLDCGRVLSSDRKTLTVEVETDGTANQIRSLLDQLDPDRRLVERFALRSPTLDDVFLAFTGHATHNAPEHEVAVGA
jgi:ABC-2 type transport system ATP-binding protein